VIARKKKICKSCGKEKFIFSHGRCQVCAAKEKMKRKSQPTESGEERSMMAFFDEIWAERPHKSEIDGADLLPKGHKLWHWQFSHLLPKNPYAKFKFDKRNIVLKTVQQHQDWQFAQYKLKDKEEWKWVFDKYDELKREYHEV